ncbi:MAG TPA: hypothetical protein VMD74_00720, partial [Candidatus Methylomirabilis sp.]|nr:hypothetical protein [Candidatus Methylomirabilis sp.]
MADFYQILKREIEPKNLEIVERKTNNNSKVSNNTVDNFDNDSQPATQKIVTKLAKKQSAKKNLSSSMRRFSRKDTFLSLEPRNPIWLTMNETAILGGIQKRTVKRALRAGLIK